jgi:hypothetical protein
MVIDEGRARQAAYRTSPSRAPLKILWRPGFRIGVAASGVLVLLLILVVVYFQETLPAILLGAFTIYWFLWVIYSGVSIRATEQRLEVGRVLAPWTRRAFSVMDIKHVFCARTEVQSPTGSYSLFHLKLRLRNAEPFVLIDSLPSAQLVLFLERRLEEQLGLESCTSALDPDLRPDWNPDETRRDSRVKRGRH